MNCWNVSTGTDNTTQDWYQNHLHSGGNDDLADVAGQFGEQKYLIRAYLPGALEQRGVRPFGESRT